jgi:hypothetical protein
LKLGTFLASLMPMEYFFLIERGLVEAVVYLLVCFSWQDDESSVLS